MVIQLVSFQSSGRRIRLLANVAPVGVVNQVGLLMLFKILRSGKDLLANMTLVRVEMGVLVFLQTLQPRELLVTHGAFHRGDV